MSTRLAQASSLIETLNKRRIEAENEARRARTEFERPRTPEKRQSPKGSPVKKATPIRVVDDEENNVVE